MRACVCVYTLVELNFKATFVRLGTQYLSARTIPSQVLCLGEEFHHCFFLFADQGKSLRLPASEIMAGMEIRLLL